MEEKIMFQVGGDEAGSRLDKLLAERFSEHSRQYFQRLLQDGAVKVNGKVVRSSYKVRERDKVWAFVPAAQSLELKPKAMGLDIVYEDDDVVVVNKPAGLVVHPGEGETHQEDSLVNGLLAHCGDQLSGINGVLRPGIVHRLDKDTSGLIIVAKNDHAHRFLAEQFEQRQVDKFYDALVVGQVDPSQGTIESPIGRDVHDRKKMAVTSEDKGRMAISHYEVVKRYKPVPGFSEGFSYLRVTLITGRTHQIRVHFASIGFPLVGDDLYGRPRLNRDFQKRFSLERQFLHAGTMKLVLPSAKAKKTAKKTVFTAPLPPELKNVLAKL